MTVRTGVVMGRADNSRSSSCGMTVVTVITLTGLLNRSCKGDSGMVNHIMGSLEVGIVSAMTGSTITGTTGCITIDTRDQLTVGGHIGMTGRTGVEMGCADDGRRGRCGMAVSRTGGGRSDTGMILNVMGGLEVGVVGSMTRGTVTGTAGRITVCT